MNQEEIVDRRTFCVIISSMTIEARKPGEPGSIQEVLAKTESTIGQLSENSKSAYTDFLELIKDDHIYEKWAITTAISRQNERILDFRALLADGKTINEEAAHKALYAGIKTRENMRPEIEFMFNGYLLPNSFASESALLVTIGSHYRDSIDPSSVEVIEFGPIR